VIERAVALAMVRRRLHAISRAQGIRYRPDADGMPAAGKRASRRRA